MTPNPKLPGVTFGDNIAIRAIPRIYNDVFLAHGLNVIGGNSGANKTTLAAEITARETEDGGAVLVSTEDADFVYKARVMAAGGNPALVGIANNADWMFPRDLSAFETAVRETKTRLVILDTAQKHFECPLTSPKVAHVCKQLDKIAQRHGVAVLLLSHTIKSVTRSAMKHDPKNCLGGSTGGLVGSARLVVLVGKLKRKGLDAPEERALVVVKDNYSGREGRVMLYDLDSEEITDPTTGATIEAGFVSLTDDDHTVADWKDYAADMILGEAQSRGPDATAKIDAAEFLTQLLATGPVPVETYTDPQHGEIEGIKQLAKAEGLSWASVRRAKDECGIEAVKDKHPDRSMRRWRWQLPTGHPALVTTIPAAPTTNP